MDNSSYNFESLLVLLVHLFPLPECDIAPLFLTIFYCTTCTIFPTHWVCTHDYLVLLGHSFPLNECGMTSTSPTILIWILTPLAAALSRPHAHEGQTMDNMHNMVQSPSKCSCSLHECIQNVLSMSKPFKMFLFSPWVHSKCSFHEYMASSDYAKRSSWSHFSINWSPWSLDLHDHILILHSFIIMSCLQVHAQLSGDWMHEPSHGIMVISLQHSTKIYHWPQVNVYYCTTTQNNSSHVWTKIPFLKYVDKLLDNYIQFYHHALKQELINVCIHHC